MLDVEGGIDIDPCREQFFYILVPFQVPGTGDIGVGQFVHKDQLRVGRKDCIEIHLGEFYAMVLDGAEGNDGKAFHEHLGLVPPVGFDVPDPYIDSLVLSRCAALSIS